jgi:hypothetical protein
MGKLALTGGLGSSANHTPLVGKVLRPFDEIP